MITIKLLTKMVNERRYKMRMAPVTVQFVWQEWHTIDKMEPNEKTEKEFSSMGRIGNCYIFSKPTAKRILDKITSK